MELYILLNNVRSAFNVGSIFRTSDAVGVKKIYLSGYSPYPPNFRLEKTALGATNFVNWEYEKDIFSVLKYLREQEIPIISAEQTEKSVDYRDIKYPKRLCLAMGNEVSGIEDEILKDSMSVVEIPMYGKKNSLNVSVAFGILVYHIKNNM
ncbi:RNA methyltransferase [Patescibacteria group bacterium]|nr:RNA methyltransferase [Patescibacteria group bacterium]